MKRFTWTILNLALASASSLCVPANAGTTQDLKTIADRLGEGVAIDARTAQIQLSGKRFKSYYRAYACPNFAAASAVVSAIPKSADRSGTVARQVAAMRTALGKQGCTPARGSFWIMALGNNVRIDHGYEAEENWVAAQAHNKYGQELGLIIDTSPYGPVQ